MAQPDSSRPVINASGGFGTALNKPPLALGQSAAHHLEYDSGRDVVENREALDEVAVVLGQTKPYPGAAVVPDDRCTVGGPLPAMT